MGDFWESLKKKPDTVYIRITENTKTKKIKKHMKSEKSGLHVKTNKTGILTGETLRLFLSRDDSLKII